MPDRKPKNARELEKAQNLKRDLFLGDFRKVLSMPEGLRVFSEIMDMCHVFAPSFTGNSQTFFNEGARSIGLFIFGSIMDCDPKFYMKMIEEKKKNQDE